MFLLEKAHSEAMFALIQIKRQKDGKLSLLKNGLTYPVTANPCFPWTEPTTHISLRDPKGQEVAFLRDLGELDSESKAAVESALVESTFVLEIQSVESLEEEFEFYVWKVQTSHGKRTFQTKLDEWPRRVPGGGLLIKDIAGDLFYIPEPNALDVKSREILWAFVD